MSCTLSKEHIARVVKFHGHECPGLAIGIRAAELCLRELGHHDDSPLVAVVETDMCGVDAIQPLAVPPPRPPRVMDSLPCAHCGEQAMESRTRRFAGETLCIPCFEQVEQKI